jgi:hypothetical protein
VDARKISNENGAVAGRSVRYDLRYIRENLKYFIRTLGYDPVLSEEGSVFYDPREHVHDACLTEIPNCQLFILVIGGRHGSAFKGTGRSVTNAEYSEAVRLKIPVFALVEQGVLNDYQLFGANRRNSKIDALKINYPSADNTKIFEFIETVRSNTINNALVPFKDFADIESYLRQQWAGLMFTFLLRQNEEARVADTLAMLTQIGERIEMISRQILGSVGTKVAKLTAALYDKMLQQECIRNMAYMGAQPNPKTVLGSETFDQCFSTAGGRLSVQDKWEGITVGGGGMISQNALERDRKEYINMRSELIKIIQREYSSVEQYLKDAEII